MKHVSEGTPAVAAPLEKIRSVRLLWAQYGAYFVCRRAACRLAFPYWGYKLLGGKRCFQYDGRSLSYFYHRYNTAWRNERTVEVSIALDALAENTARRVLEIGNVLRHYDADTDHVVVDKYEEAPGVLNVDVTEFRSDRSFDLIVSISTLEHVGWDENPRDPEKPLRAISHLKTLLAPQGRLLITVPMGYNAILEHALEDGRAGFDKITYLERTRQSGLWEERLLDRIERRSFNDPYPGAGPVAVCEYRQLG